MHGSVMMMQVRLPSSMDTFSLSCALLLSLPIFVSVHRVHAADSSEPIEIPGLVYAFSVTQHMY